MRDFQSDFIEANGQRIHVKTAGPDGAPVMVMLHGFPEYWAAWADVAARLADRYRLILPDQRGFNLSSKPEGVEAYETKHMVADLDDLMDTLAPNQTFILCGHDWGASVAYAYAMRHAQRVSHLIIANGVHPICFQKALYAGGPQTDASQYMNVLRTPGIESRMAENGYRRLLNMFEKFSAAPWLNERVKEQYRTVWSQDNAMETMLNWYRSSPMVVPESGSAPKALDITEAMREKYRITMPHLLLWGANDVALLPEANADLDLFCDDLTRVAIDNGSHWLLHERPEVVAAAMLNWLDEG
ncbi:alpha/beta fold hydrolase [Pseudahrensia aquimaris]|uniref:Alpha/beta fold hydrolase n=1 Tax=Pseudahrensia aquimaris TaxID=744461 RepID=A0ABW3FHG9_9HYPH